MTKPGLVVDHLVPRTLRHALQGLTDTRNPKAIIGGRFTMAPGIFANGIARWDGDVWNARGDGLDDGVLPIAVNGGDLFAGGLISGAWAFSKFEVSADSLWHGWHLVEDGFGHWSAGWPGFHLGATGVSMRHVERMEGPRAGMAARLGLL